MRVEEVLRAAGNRVTVPRQQVWRLLKAANGHVTAQNLADTAVAQGLDLPVSSVYRALQLFDELGLVRESRTGPDSSATWEVRHPDGEIHLVCLVCEQVEHHRTDRVEQLRRELPTGFQPVDIDVQVTGYCATCR